MASSAVVQIDIQHQLEKLASGKVRDVYIIDDKSLLFVASDRISAYDVIMKNGIPEKGALLTQMSIYWFKYLTSQISNLRTHYLYSTLPSSLSFLESTLAPRSMTVRRLKIFPIESIVRGYITGSAWSEYKRSGTVNSIPLPEGLIEGQKLPQPLWTPSTKAEVGGKDENISPKQATEIVGEKAAKEIERLSLQIYEVAAKRAEEVGIILADTKFEFGFDPEKEDEVVLVDEVLTPDSSRFWPKDTWEQNLGRAQPSFDKQFLRDWLTENGLKGKEDVEVPEDVVRKTAEKYREAYERITGEKWKSG
ncbi:phosphoribosylaminoimidazole-succinocarboxamide synthase [Delitschia confertaspora ATCC 74209]|uniref:Phosphoribosylaminoimidazole-succinocarboxamide synthase n=1 Tax=Delitschia confertaspora ATCC 74209 TaxID=1513339 RepID=A0A9P4MZB0_9PLEO|nr:phosphoribosylaminoimidazole-succinocarboxamide synthase [Delitschia confertaspora ATCC 74209]